MASSKSDDSSQVRVLGTSEYKAAALALSEAFEHDEVARYFVDVSDRPNWTAQHKWDLHVSLMEYITYGHLMNGLVTSVGDDYGAVALWLPPYTDLDSMWTFFRSGSWRAMYKLSPEGRRRMFKEFYPLLHTTKSDVLGHRDENSWYLVYLGTRPSARGKGYAKKLIQHGASKADAQQLPIYLESSNVVNVSYYRKFGFEIAKRIELVRHDKVVHMDIMVREPASKKDGTVKKGEKVAATDGHLTGSFNGTATAPVTVSVPAAGVTSTTVNANSKNTGSITVVTNELKRDSVLSI